MNNITKVDGQRIEIEVDFNNDGSGFLLSAYNLSTEKELSETEIDILQDRLDLSVFELERDILRAEYYEGDR
jgi:hypothetical protein